MSTGFRVFLQRDLPPKELLEGFKELPAANIADCMHRLSALSSEIHLMSKPFVGSVAGPALTVKARPGDNLMLHKALNMATEGDVIVVSNEGDRSQSLMGEIMAVYGKFKKVAAFVFDGPIRDIDTIYNLEVPIYATGTTPGGPFKDGPGEINVPISCGNAYIEPGDIILGDTDGVIVIPRLDAADILEAARKFSISDKARLEAAYKGTSDRSWVEKRLESKNCIIVDAKYSDRSTFFCSEG
jgi:regulator of RNase E activity RraA